MAKRRERKKSSNKNSQKFNINHFLRNQLRNLPIDSCYIMPEWEETGLTSIVIIRRHNNGNYSAAVYFVYLLCEGIIDTFFLFNVTKPEIEELISEKEEICPYPLAHNIIWGVVEYANELGLKPHKDFIKTQYFLKEDTDNIEFIDIEFGKSGRPVVVIDKNNKKHNVTKTLDKTIGRENYDILNTDEDYDILKDLPLDYEMMGFDSREEMMESLLENVSEAEIVEYFELFYEMFEKKKSIDIDEIIQNYEKNTVIRIIETMYCVVKSAKNDEEPYFQSLFAQLFFDDIPESPFDIPDEKITYKPIELGYNKSEEEKEVHIQLLNKLKSGEKNIDKFVKKQISLYPDNPVFKGLLYKHLFEKNKIRKIRRNIEKDYRMNPEYLFLKLYYGELLLKDKLYDKVNEIFDNKTRLDELYPERKVFHITEYVSFCHFFIQFNIAIGQLETAIQYYDALSKYYVEGNEELMVYIGNIILEAKTKFLSSINS